MLDAGAPAVTRIALATTPDGAPLSLVSELSAHTAALEANPACALLVGEPEDNDLIEYLSLQTVTKLEIKTQRNEGRYTP